MGDPRKLRKKYSKPSHPWQKARIDDEASLMKEYGFKNKAELWKLNSKLLNFKAQVKKLIPKRDEVAEKQRKELISRLQKFGLLTESAILEDILAINLKDLCERRLQTLVFRQSKARSVSQARQFIVHEHIMIGDKKITSPSYIVDTDQEKSIKFADTSSLTSEDHPERLPIVKELKKEIEATKKKNVEDEPDAIDVSEVEEVE